MSKARSAFTPATVTVPFVGDAVGVPISGGLAGSEVIPTAAQAFHGLVETLPAIAPEVGAILPEVAEVAGASLNPGLGPLALAGAAAGVTTGATAGAGTGAAGVA